MKGYKWLANLMKALAHPIRLQILELLLDEGEACVCHLERGLRQRQAYISQQLAKLREVGLVADRREGLNIFYAVVDSGVADLIQYARRFVVEAARRDGREIDFKAIRPPSPEQCPCPKCEEKIALTKERD
jgi:ArsR family transcriptional regulator